MGSVTIYRNFRRRIRVIMGLSDYVPLSAYHITDYPLAPIKVPTARGTAQTATFLKALYAKTALRRSSICGGGENRTLVRIYY